MNSFSPLINQPTVLKKIRYIENTLEGLVFSEYERSQYTKVFFE